MNKKIKTTEDKLIMAGAISATMFLLGFFVFKQFGSIVINQQTQIISQASGPDLSTQTPASAPTPTSAPPVERVERIDSNDHRITYQLLNGWNFVSLPISPINFNNASGLLGDIVQKEGYATVIAKWDGDRWLEYVIRGNEVFGEDFLIYPGEGYFIRNHITISWSVSGVPATQESLGSYGLQKGWNTAGFIIKDQKAETILDSINQGAENATEITWWDSGSWQPFVKRIYSPDNIESYGINFPIDKTKGYMIKLNQDSTWSNK